MSPVYVRLLAPALVLCIGCAGDAFDGRAELDPPAVDAAIAVVNPDSGAVVKGDVDPSDPIDAAGQTSVLDSDVPDVLADAGTARDAAYAVCEASYLRTCAADPSACSTLTLVQVCGDGG